MCSFLPSSISSCVLTPVYVWINITFVTHAQNKQTLLVCICLFVCLCVCVGGGNLRARVKCPTYLVYRMTWLVVTMAP